MANGQKVIRSVGFAILRVEGRFTIDEVVFAEETDWGHVPQKVLI